MIILILTAFAGNALNITGVTPLYNEKMPSFLIISAKTPRIPFLYLPSGAGNVMIKLYYNKAIAIYYY